MFQDRLDSGQLRAIDVTVFHQAADIDIDLVIAEASIDIPSKVSPPKVSSGVSTFDLCFAVLMRKTMPIR